MIAASGRFDLPFTCVDSTGAPVAPTGTPTGTLVKNGTDLGTTVTVTMSTAQGVASCTIPSDAVNGDRFYIRISAVISAVTYVLPGPVETVQNTVVLTSDYDAAKTAATQTSVNTVDTVVDALAVELGKVPKVGSTHRYTQVDAVDVDKSADVTISEAT